MAQTFGVKYRPDTLDKLVGQKSIIQILEQQLKLRKFKNCYLFTGSTGIGKTTISRAFANAINRNQGSPIEIDAASNNGVDNIRNIIEDAKQRALDCEYKIYIIDEAHMLTTQSWNALLKCLEEPPMYTIFIFCTTDPQKIPATILNRVQRFNLTKLSTDEIRKRLQYVCEQEHLVNYDETIDYIAKIADGGMRDALSYLDKVSVLSNDLDIKNTLEILGDCSYTIFFSLVNALIDADEKSVISIVEDYYNKGNDLKLFINQFIDFIMDLNKYCIFKDFQIIKIPQAFESDIKYATELENSHKYFNYLLDKLLEIKNLIKYDANKNTVLIMFIAILRG